MAFPKDLRQRMINLMYLVLMALLALQIDASTLLAFRQVNEGLDNAAEAFNKQNTSLLTAIREKAEEGGENSSAASLYQHSLDIQSVSNSAVNFLNQVISEVEAVTRQEKDTTEMDLYSKDGADLVMLEEEGSKNRAPEVKQRLDSVRNAFIQEINETDELSDQEKQNLINTISVNTEIPEDLPNPDNLGWEEFTYRGKPAVALLTLLKQAQNDIKASESNILGTYAQKLDIDQLKFDQFRAAVIPSSTYLQQGDTFTADIFLAASSSQGANNYTVTVNGRTLAVDENGVAQYSASPGVGQYELNGQITINNPETGETTVVPFENPVTYQVAAPSATVSADKMNVMYIGLDNPISVSAAGVSLDNVAASCSGCQLTRSGAGKYIANVSEQGTATVSVSANGKRMGSKEFRIMRVPDPVVKLGTKKPGASFTTGEIGVQSFVQADLENFVFDARFQVQKFSMTLASPGKSSWTGRATGSQLTQEMRNNLGRIGPGWQVVVHNVTAQGPDGTTRTLGGVVYSIR